MRGAGKRGCGGGEKKKIAKEGGIYLPLSVQSFEPVTSSLESAENSHL